MSTVKETVRVDVPIRTAYDQWTQFEDFPQFMGGVESVEQRSPALTHWVAKVGGVKREFDAQITDQVPDERVSWETVEGSEVRQAGLVAFHSVDDRHTDVALTLDYGTEGIAESIADKMGFVRKQVEGDLQRFKRFVEERGGATGAWRGTI